MVGLVRDSKLEGMPGNALLHTTFLEMCVFMLACLVISD